jgi:hypothetical protein
LGKTNFIQILIQFGQTEKDLINEETIEFMQPYLDLPNFDPKVAKNASSAAQGICVWVKAMMQYHEASKVVKPKLEKLHEAQGHLLHATEQLHKAEERVKACRDVMAAQTAQFEKQVQHKARIEANALATRERMNKATSLVTDLADEKNRWTEDKDRFKRLQTDLAGDCAYAATFLTYCGAFSQATRKIMMQAFQFQLDGGGALADNAESAERSRVTVAGTHSALHTISATPIQRNSKLRLSDFLVDRGQQEDWVLHGLPLDVNSLQNALLISSSPRFPILVDPQGQALKWLLSQAAMRLPMYGVMDRKHPKLREQLGYALGEGRVLVVSGVDDSSLDAHLMSVVRRNIVLHGTFQRIEVGDNFCSYDPNFALYLVTRSPTAVYSPELQSYAMIVDFSVTQQGLGEQLLGLVIQREQASLEQQLQEALSVVASSSKELQTLDEVLLSRLSASHGNMLDDEELIRTLSSTKAKHSEVRKKFQTAAATREEIRQKREEFRAVATRGAILYASVVDMTSVSPMYQVSLEKFSHLFVTAMRNAPSAQITARRVTNIVDELTYAVHRFISRGLYVRHKLIFVTLLLLKMYVVEAKLITNAEVEIFLRCGALLTKTELDCVGRSPLEWITATVWRNIVTISQNVSELRTLSEVVQNASNQWQVWAESTAPEHLPVPHFQTDVLRGTRGQFLKLLLVRAFREDRATNTIRKLIRESGSDFKDSQVGTPRTSAANTTSLSASSISTTNITAQTSVIDGSQNGSGDGVADLGDAAADGSLERTSLLGLGEKYLLPTVDNLADVYSEMDCLTPAVFLLSAGADPTDKILQFSRRQKKEMSIVSMGQGQEVVASRLIRDACSRGGWVLMQNCHLGLECTRTVESIIRSFCDEWSGRGRGRGDETGLSEVEGSNGQDTQIDITGEHLGNNGQGKSSMSHKGGKVLSSIAGGSAGSAENEEQSHGDEEGSRRIGRLHPGFRLFMTTEPHHDFPARILQKAIKVTNEPPRGLKEGLKRSFSTLVDQDKLERIEDSSWRTILFTTCFLHSVVQERGQYVSVGWNVAYEFNMSDLQCSLQFLEKHLYGATISWATVQYMLSQVFYGGKITDRQDARLFAQIVKQWVSVDTLASSFSFNPHGANIIDTLLRDFQYQAPDAEAIEIDDFRKHIETFPELDPPELFGLHPNASLRFMLDESQTLLQSVSAIRRASLFGNDDNQSFVDEAADTDADSAVPTAVDGELAVLQMVRDILGDLPTNMRLLAKLKENVSSANKKRAKPVITSQSSAASANTANALEARSAAAMNEPLAHFLKQEIARMVNIQDRLEKHLKDIELSITAIVQKTPELVVSINELSQGVTPSSLLAGTWHCSSFGRWLDVLRRRHLQLTIWRNAGGVRPASVWLGGLFNPVGFLISVRQGVARAIRIQEDRALALDEMALHAEVTEIYEVSNIGRDKDSTGRLVAGVYLHGLILEGAAWSKVEQSLVESAPKILTCPMPVVYMTCLTKLQKRNTTGDYGAYGAYNCPCYKYKIRSEDTFVFNIDLSSRQHRPRHWIMRGVAILCSDVS